MKLPQATVLTTIVKLSSILFFAGAASCVLLGIDAADRNLYLKIEQKQLKWCLIFFALSLVYLAHASYILHAVNSKLTDTRLIFLNVTNLAVFIGASLTMGAMCYYDRTYIS